jgi:hypothetical protein
MKRPARDLRILQALIDLRFFELGGQGDWPELVAAATEEHQRILSEYSTAEIAQFEGVFRQISLAADQADNTLEYLSDASEACKLEDI